MTQRIRMIQSNNSCKGTWYNERMGREVRTKGGLDTLTREIE